jgi:hypothetical protein
VSTISTSDPLMDFLDDYTIGDQPSVAIFNFLQLEIITWWMRERVVSE